MRDEIVTSVPDADYRFEFTCVEGEPVVSLNGNDLTEMARGVTIMWTRGGRPLISVDYDCFPRMDGYADIVEVRLHSRRIAS